APVGTPSPSVNQARDAAVVEVPIPCLLPLVHVAFAPGPPLARDDCKPAPFGSASASTAATAIARMTRGMDQFAPSVERAILIIGRDASGGWPSRASGEWRRDDACRTHRADNSPTPDPCVVRSCNH